MSDRTLFTSESVTEGHPDKIADQISDSVLDAILAQDPMARVACETLLTTGLCVVAGEISTSAYVDINHLARQTIIGIGYDDGAMGFDGRSCGILVSLDKQSPDIADGVDVALEQRSGAGGVDPSTIENDVLEHVIRPMLPATLDATSMRVFVNPSGKFVLGGPHADTGLT